MYASGAGCLEGAMALRRRSVSMKPGIQRGFTRLTCIRRFEALKAVKQIETAVPSSRRMKRSHCLCLREPVMHDLQHVRCGSDRQVFCRNAASQLNSEQHAQLMSILQVSGLRMKYLSTGVPWLLNGSLGLARCSPAKSYMERSYCFEVLGM